MDSSWLSIVASQIQEAMESLKLGDTSKTFFSEERDQVGPDSKDEVMQDVADTVDLESNIWARIPEELLEKVFAKLPFKHLFQTRMLSKSWAAKLCSASFQAEVSQVASRWDSYCPVYIGNEGLIGYNRSFKRCERLLTLSYLPHRQALLIPNSRGKLSAYGPLLSFVDLNQFPSIYVTNIITQTWKVLPPRPNMDYPAIIHLFLVGINAYRILLITPLATPCVQIYDSASWSMRYSESAPEASTQLWPANSRWASCNRDRYSAHNAWTDSTYFQNTLYVLWGHRHDGPCELLAYKVEEESWSNIQISALSPLQQQSGINLYFIPMSRIPFVLFPDTQQIVEVSRGPPLERVVPIVEMNEASCDDECIYFFQNLSFKPVVVFNTLQQEWSCLPSVFDTPILHHALKKRSAPGFFMQPTPSCFHPGCSPFIAV